MSLATTLLYRTVTDSPAHPQPHRTSPKPVQPISPTSVKSPRHSGRRFLVRATGIIVIVVMLISVLLPSLCRSRETANRVKCASNLRQIGDAIALYAHDHGGHYPPSLAVLVAQGQLQPDLLVCPSCNDEAASAADTAAAARELAAAENNAPGHEHCLSYVYTGRGLTVATASESAIIAYEPLDNHAGIGTNVLFGDGHVEFIQKLAWPKIAADAGVAVVPSVASGP